MKEQRFNFFESYHRALSRVSNERYGRVVRAMCAYAFMDEQPTFEDDADWIVWELIKPILERGHEISQTRAEAGRHGGLKGKGVTRNTGNQNAKKESEKQKQNNSKTIATEKQNNSGIGIGKGKGINKEKTKKEDPSSYDYVSPEFREVFDDWLAYKRERNEAYKPRGARSFYNRLVELSGNDPQQARLIVEQSMSNNYQGIFELKGGNYYGNSNSRPDCRQLPAENIAAAQRDHLQRISTALISEAETKR